LLRVVEDEFERGGTQTIKTDVKIIAATNSSTERSKRDIPRGPVLSPEHHPDRSRQWKRAERRHPNRSSTSSAELQELARQQRLSPALTCSSATMARQRASPRRRCIAPSSWSNGDTVTKNEFTTYPRGPRWCRQRAHADAQLHPQPTRRQDGDTSDIYDGDDAVDNSHRPRLESSNGRIREAARRLACAQHAEVRSRPTSP
jgi:hypothetical protein